MSDPGAEPKTKGEGAGERADADAAPVRVHDEPGSDGRAGVLRVVTIDRPAALNAIDPATMAALDEAFADCEKAATRGSLRAVILTGAGQRAFAAGADVAALSTMSAGQARAFSALGHQVGHRIESLSVPVIAAVNGFALGGGCEMALACDFIYASASARFGQPEARLGAIPGFGGTQRLARRIGHARACELLFTADLIDAAEALRIGLVNRVLSDPGTLMDAARAVALRIAQQAPLAVAQAKRALRRGADRPLEEANRMEIEMFAELFDTADLPRGMRAFLNKEKSAIDWERR